MRRTHSDSDRRLLEAQHRGFVFAAVVCLVSAVLFCGVYMERVSIERAECAEEKINPNTADAASLVRLPHIGPARAQAIIEYRDSAGATRFTCPADMEKVRGIGPKTVEQIEPWLAFN